MNSSPNDIERLSGNSWVLDASALLAAILEEPGYETVRDAIAEGAFIGAVNFSEAVARLARDFSHKEIQDFLRVMELTVVDFDEDGAWRTASLLPATRSIGLSLGDRACLALGAGLAGTVLTADRSWANLDVGVEVVLCR